MYVLLSLCDTYYILERISFSHYMKWVCLLAGEKSDREADSCRLFGSAIVDFLIVRSFNVISNSPVVHKHKIFHPKKPYFAANYV